MLADDKLAEAHFFLKRMRRCKKYSHLRYYLSAFMSAARSVTLVLQKDLRDKYSNRFDTWYEEQKLKLVFSQTAAIVKLCRNVALKEGNRLPLYTLRFHDPGHSEEYLELKIDLGTKQKITGFKYHFQDDESIFIVDKNRPIEEQMKEKTLENFPRRLAKMEHLAGKLFHDIKPQEFVSFNADESPKPLKLWIKELDDYLTLLQGIVNEAKSTFGS